MNKAVKTFDCFLQAAFQELHLKYVYLNDFKTFYNDCINLFSSQMQKSPPKLSDESDVAKMYKFLRETILSMEQRFDEAICFPADKVLPQIAQFKFGHRRPFISTENHEILDEKMQQMSVEYIRRNKVLQEQESQGVKSIIQLAMKVYADDIKREVGKRYLDQATLEELFERNYLNVEAMFLESCDFKEQSLADQYKMILRHHAIQKDDLISEIHSNNKNFLEEELDKIVCSSKELYEGLTKQNLVSSGDPSLFSQMNQSLLQKTRDNFEDELLSRIGNQHKKTVEKWRKQMEILLSEMSHKILSVMVEDNIKIQQDVQPIRKPRPRLISQRAASEFSKLSQYMIVHIGLRYTRAAIFRSNSTALKIGESEENWAFFTSNLRIQSDELLQDTCFLGSFLNKPIDGKYKVEICGTQYLYRLEDFISYRLKDLKSKIEGKYQRKLSKCIICLPQCLNRQQRKIIQDGAGSAGFDKVELIGDTNAIALAYIMDNKLFTGTLVAANFKGGSFDVGWFTTQKGAVTCDAVSGDYFVDRPAGGFHWSRKKIWYHELEEKTKQVLAKEHGQSQKDVFIICGGNRDYGNIVKKHFPSLQIIEAVDEEFPIRGAAQFLILANTIEDNPQQLKDSDMEIFKRLKRDIVSEVTKDATKSSNIARAFKLLPALAESSYGANAVC